MVSRPQVWMKFSLTTILNMPRRLPATSLIEVMFYFTILAIFLMIGLTFSIQILEVTTVSSNVQELQSNMDFVMDRITYTIKTAESVDADASLFDVNEGVLVLNMPSPASSPVIFSLTDGDVFMQAGSDPQVQLNSVGVEFDSLNFHRLTYEKAPDQIQISALASPELEEISSFEQSVQAQVSVSLRHL
jgi:hypothetical protein